MKTLILRTFAHTDIWEGNEPRCHFEGVQKAQILGWEPDYLKLKIADFDYALGIYIDKYFQGYTDLNGGKKIANKGSANEQIISRMKLVKWPNNDSFVEEENEMIYVYMSLQNKLWSGPRKDLMLKIDYELIQTKENELRRHGERFKPLSFSLESDVVRNILSRNGVT